jgi:NAD(P)-dependent dehydrogenase (short-subunit alcohol dehydrogenase family)
MTEEELKECLRVLEAVVEDRSALAAVDLDTRNRLLTAAGRVSRPDRDAQRLLSRALRKQKHKAIKAQDEQILARAGIRQLRAAPVFVTPSPRQLAEAALGPNDGPSPAGAAPELNAPRACYVCKTPSARVHPFYDQMCPPCGEFNYAKRSQTADLTGRTAMISGARVKIGYQAAILLLRAGARVIVTTRFARDAAQRYAREPDFECFRDRLVIYGLDLRHTPSVETFARHIDQTEERLDFLVHNACQTVRRPVGFYRHLMEGELGPLDALPTGAAALLERYEAMRGHGNGHSLAPQDRPDIDTARAVGLSAAASLSQVALIPEDVGADAQLFPMDRLDADLQQVDLREINSWRLPLHQVSTVELLEVQLVNAIAPFVLNARLKPLMLRHRTFDKHIVNVSAMEGQFYRRFKTDKHPHTNMAKAALNMMTRTSAADYARDGIFMNSVDTGWVTDEDPAHIARRKTEENGFHPPLDIVDGAARIVDPIFHGMNTGDHVSGQFLKDYRSAPW